MIPKNYIYIYIELKYIFNLIGMCLEQCAMWSECVVAKKRRSNRTPLTIPVESALIGDLQIVHLIQQGIIEGTSSIESVETKEE